MKHESKLKKKQQIYKKYSEKWMNVQIENNCKLQALTLIMSHDYYHGHLKAPSSAHKKIADVSHQTQPLIISWKAGPKQVCSIFCLKSASPVFSSHSSQSR